LGPLHSNGNFTVEGSASVVFQAGSTITLLPGFTAGGSGSPAFQAVIAPVSQYQLTTSASPAAGGTVAASPCSSNGYYSSGTVVTLTATPNSGYQFVNWSTGATTNTLTVTVNSALSITANFSALAQPLSLSSYGPLKGVEYFPRGHAFYSMLYDWYTYDNCTSTLNLPNWQAGCGTGQYVYQIVQSDLATLKANGINFIHLYLWDQDIVQDTLHPPQAPLVQSGLSAPGFVGWDDGGPQVSPGNNGYGTQWEALKAFISTAQSNDIYVALDFATSRATKEVATDGYQSTGGNFGLWVQSFMGLLSSYNNVLIWGLDYGIQPPTDSNWGMFWQEAYSSQSYGVLPYLQKGSYPAGRPLLMVSSNFGSVWPDCCSVQPILNLTQWTDTANNLSYYGYQWTSANGNGAWFQAQQTPSTWQQYGITPDLYSFLMYNASTNDLEAALEAVSSAIPFSQMIVTEVATGSSLASSPIGNGLAFEGDAQTLRPPQPDRRNGLPTRCAFSPDMGFLHLGGMASTTPLPGGKTTINTADILWRGTVTGV
jgi:Divergent InlB B-repeat domain